MAQAIESRNILRSTVSGLIKETRRQSAAGVRSTAVQLAPALPRPPALNLMMMLSPQAQALATVNC